MIYTNTKGITLFVNIFSIVLGLIIAALGIFAYEEFIEFICITLGVGIIIVNVLYIVLLLSSAKMNKITIIELVFSIVYIGLGILFIINHGLAVSIVFGCILIVFPIIRILISIDKKTQAKKEIPYFILGALLLLNITDILFRIAIITFGALLVILGIVNIILSNRVISEQNKKDKDYIDVEIIEK